MYVFHHPEGMSTARGANDIQTHIGSKKHKSAVESSKSTAGGSGNIANIANFFQPKAFSVIGAETLMTQVLCLSVLKLLAQVFVTLDKFRLKYFILPIKNVFSFQEYIFCW